ncbi:MAG: TlyA family RNA methyltransferase [Proteobacteria bacterium]|nr:TlyA family RNA methyltransferase [Pseudomonadota bacterium]
MSRPVRLDRLLVQRGLAPSRARARELIEEGRVTYDGLKRTKTSTQVNPDREVLVDAPDHSWVSRGAKKLLGAIDSFGVDPRGQTCADLGASTGGFTEVLLERGAKRVYAIDVGVKQLAYKLRNDSRVVLKEGINARYLEELPEAISLVVGDLSFISLRLILPTVIRLLGDGGEAVLLVKPQFEVGPAAVGKGGKVRDENARKQAIEAIGLEAQSLGMTIVGGQDCTVPGAKAGNIEYFFHLRQ